MQHDPTRNRRKLGHLPRPARLRRAYVVTVPAPSSYVTFSAGVEALKRIEKQRQAREDRMRNALEILSEVGGFADSGPRDLARFVRATAREGLGRE